MHASRLAAVMLCALLVSAARAHTSAAPQQQPPDSGLALAKSVTKADEEKPHETVADLQQLVGGEGRKDADAWYRLGLAHTRAGDTAAAREAFREALKLRSGHVAARALLAYTLFLDGHLDEAEKEAARAYSKAVRGEIEPEDKIAISVHASLYLQRFRLRCAEVLPRIEQALAANPDDAQLHLTRAQALIGLNIPEPRLVVLLSLLDDVPPDEDAQKAARERSKKLYAGAAESFENYLRLAPKARDAEYVRGQLDALRFYIRGFDGHDATEATYQASKVTKKAIVTKKPEPGYTGAARDAGVTGIIRVRVIFAADGTVKHPLVLKPLSHGLAEKVVRAARGIRFKPAVLDGRPVSQYATLEYNFNIY